MTLITSSDPNEPKAGRMIVGYRIVSAWVPRGDPKSLMMTRAATYVIVLAMTLLGLMVFGFGVSLYGLLADPDSLPRSNDEWVNPVIALIVTGCITLLARRVRFHFVELERAAVAASGAEAAFSRACETEPHAVSQPSPDRTSRWMEAFRSHSGDHLLLDSNAARALGAMTLSASSSSVTLTGPTRMFAFGVGCMVPMLLLPLMTLWGHVWWHRAVLMLCGAGWIATLRFLYRWQARHGGSRVIALGTFRHNSQVWEAPQSVMAVRLDSAGKSGWFRVMVIGPAGVSALSVRDSPTVREQFKVALSLWVTPTALKARAAFREAGRTVVASQIGLGQVVASPARWDDDWVSALRDAPTRPGPDSQPGHAHQVARSVAAATVIWAGPLAETGCDGDLPLDAEGLRLDRHLVESPPEPPLLSPHARELVTTCIGSVAESEIERRALTDWLDRRTRSLLRRHWPEIQARAWQEMRSR